MKKLILFSLLAFSSLFADYYHGRPQVYYPDHSRPESASILGTGEHKLMATSPDGIIEIQDGTQFKVIPSHRNEIKYWQAGDILTFSPNPYPYPFGGSEFYIVNETTGEYFKADIWTSPSTTNPNTFRLEKIERYRSEIILICNQGMRLRWEINPDDFESVCRYWKVGDNIVTGKNNNWFSSYFSDHEHILVSYSATEKVLYVRANQKPL